MECFTSIYLLQFLSYLTLHEMATKVGNANSIHVTLENRKSGYLPTTALLTNTKIYSVAAFFRSVEKAAPSVRKAKVNTPLIFNGRGASFFFLSVSSQSVNRKLSKPGSPAAR